MDLQEFGSQLFGLSGQLNKYADAGGVRSGEEDSFDDEDYTPNKNKKRTRAKPKVVARWNDADIFKLISYVEVEPATWNAAHKDYSNKYARSLAWGRVAEKCNGILVNFFQSVLVFFNCSVGFFFQFLVDKYTEADLSAKWSNLRIQFRSYMVRCTKTRSGQGTEEAPRWKFYSAMSFVGRAEAIQTSETVSNFAFGDSELFCLNVQLLNFFIRKFVFCSVFFFCYRPSRRRCNQWSNL